MKVNSKQFRQDLRQFASVCMVVRGLENVRFGAIGARTGPFNTVRYSEKLLEESGISVETIDLSEILAAAEGLGENDEVVKQKVEALKDYTVIEGVDDEYLRRIARFGCAVDKWVAEAELDGTAIQCWTSLQENYGIAPCVLMSMMSESLLPSACEVDVTGLLGMYILQLAGGRPSALMDWNNNYGEEKDKCVVFHCSNLAKSFFEESAMSYQDIIAAVVGKENAYGTVVGRVSPGPVTFCRTSTDDTAGIIKSYVGEGEFTDDKLETFGGYGVLKIEALEELLAYICREGFEHHVALSRVRKSEAIAEALGNYMGWEVYNHC